MSKFLKFLVGLILLVFIAAGAALIIPQFVGNMDTIIVQEGMVSNKPVGTVIYAQKESADDLQIGDKVLDMDANTIYVHEVISYDRGTQTAQVTGSTPTTVRIADSFSRALVSVPLIGYLTIATQTMPGLILLGLLLGLLILLFVASEILRRGAEEDEEAEEGRGDVFARNPEEEDEEETDFYRDLAQRKRETESLAHVTDALPKPVPPSGLFAEEAKELAEADAEEEEGATADTKEESGEEDQPADGMTELKEAQVEEAVEEGKEEKPLGTGELPDVQAALEAALENQQLNRSDRPKGNTAPLVEEAAEEIVVPNENGEIELAMPVHTAEELVSKAYAAGLDPTVREDKANGVTFVDYSDCL